MQKCCSSFSYGSIFTFPGLCERKTWKGEMTMLKWREECYTYLTHVYRHHWRGESPVKRWNSLCLQLIKAIMFAEISLYFIFSPGSLHSSDAYRSESGRCRTFPIFFFPCIIIKIEVPFLPWNDGRAVGILLAILCLQLRLKFWILHFSEFGSTWYGSTWFCGSTKETFIRRIQIVEEKAATWTHGDLVWEAAYRLEEKNRRTTEVHVLNVQTNFKYVKN